MATTTITVTAGDEWTALVDGSNFATCQIQVSSSQPLALAVADVEPEEDATGFIVVNSDQPLIPFTLETSETIWGRGFNGASTVRVIQTEVA
jgi:hypothetical protein